MLRFQGFYENSAQKFLNRLKEDRLIFQQIQGIKGACVKIDGKWTLNFVSAGFLGLHRHPKVLKSVSSILKKWGTSIVIPRLWGVDHYNTQLEREIAILVKQQKAITFPSTTHLALDVISLLAGQEGLILIDERAYPTSLQGAYASRRSGSKIRYFKHNDPLALMKAIKAKKAFKKIVIICDGVYSPEGSVAPLDDFLEIADEFNAFIYVDDANGIGILGEFPHTKMPYGYKGGGTPNYFGLNPSKRILHAGTLSKAFGVPVAFIATNSVFINRLKHRSNSYTHSSPPSIPELAAALTSLKIHNMVGDKLRSRLYSRIHQFKNGLSKAGINLATTHSFPIQTVLFSSMNKAEAFAVRLRRNGIWSLLQFHPIDHPENSVVRFVITALHSREDIEDAIGKIANLI